MSVCLCVFRFIFLPSVGSSWKYKWEFPLILSWLKIINSWPFLEYNGWECMQLLNLRDPNYNVCS